MVFSVIIFMFFVGLLLDGVLSFEMKLFFRMIKGRRVPIAGIAIACFLVSSDCFFELKRFFRSLDRLESY